MKNQPLASIGLGLLLAAASAYTQTGVVKANVPFNFIVDQSHASRWRIHRSASQPRARATTIQSPDRKLAKMVPANACESVNPAEKTKLVSHATGASTSWRRF